MKTYSLILTHAEIQELARLMDVAIKAKGLEVVKTGAILLLKIESAEEIKEEIKDDTKITSESLSK